jgi:hypothetical protein
MPRRSVHLQRIAEIADGQGGIVTAAQMRMAGIPSATIFSVSQPGRLLRRVLPGIYVCGQAPMSRAQREATALLHGAPEAQLTGIAALAHYGVSDLPVPLAAAPVQILMPDTRGVSSAGHVLVERTIRLPSPRLVDSQPLAPPPRALFDACRRHHTNRNDVRAVVFECLRDRLVTPEELGVEIENGQRRWTSPLRQSLAEFVAGVISPPEADVRDGLHAAGLQGFEWNPTLFTDSGDRIGQPDGYDVDCGLALEIDSRRHHSEHNDWIRTLERNARFATMGIVVISIVPASFRRQPGRVVRQITEARRSLAGRPAPRVVVHTRDGRVLRPSAKSSHEPH